MALDGYGRDYPRQEWKVTKAEWENRNQQAKQELADYGGAKAYATSGPRAVNSAQVWRRGRNSAVLDTMFGKERPLLPICPYGCGREGTLLEVVMLQDGKALGIFNDYPCSCIFVAEVQVPPTPNERKQKIVIGADGEAQVVDEDAE